MRLRLELLVHIPFLDPSVNRLYVGGMGAGVIKIFHDLVFPLRHAGMRNVLWHSVRLSPTMRAFECQCDRVHFGASWTRTLHNCGHGISDVAPRLPTMGGKPSTGRFMMRPVHLLARLITVARHTTSGAPLDRKTSVRSSAIPTQVQHFVNCGRRAGIVCGPDRCGTSMACTCCSTHHGRTGFMIREVDDRIIRSSMPGRIILIVHTCAVADINDVASSRSS